MQEPNSDAQGDAAATTDAAPSLPSLAETGEPAARSRPARAALLLALFSFLIFNANLRQIGAGDTLPARYLPLAIWRYHTLELDPIARLVAHGHPMQWRTAPGS